MLKGFPVAAATTETALGALDGAVASHDINKPWSGNVLHSRSMQAQLGTAVAALAGCALTDGRHKTAHEVSIGAVLASVGLLARRGAYAVSQHGQTKPVTAQGAMAHGYMGGVQTHVGAAGALVPPLPSGAAQATVGAAG